MSKKTRTIHMSPTRNTCQNENHTEPESKGMEKFHENGNKQTKTKT